MYRLRNGVGVPLLFDADNDGYEDIYISNGIYRDLTNQDFLEFDAGVNQRPDDPNWKKRPYRVSKQNTKHCCPNKFYHNLGNLKFEDAGVQWGISQNSFSNGAAYADLDNDGDLDLVVNNVNEPAFILKNNSREMNHNHFLGFQLKGDSVNTFAIGSKIIVYKKGQELSREINPTRGFQSSVDYKQIIGLGKDSLVDSVIIIWPDRSYQKIQDFEVDKVNTISKNSSIHIAYQQKTDTLITYFQVSTSAFDKHKENDFIDFYQEKAIPEMLSCEGPKAAVGDVNGDGLDDIYIAGTVRLILVNYTFNRKMVNFKRNQNRYLINFQGLKMRLYYFLTVMEMVTSICLLVQVETRRCRAAVNCSTDVDQ